MSASPKASLLMSSSSGQKSQLDRTRAAGLCRRYKGTCSRNPEDSDAALLKIQQNCRRIEDRDGSQGRRTKSSH